MRHRTLRFPRSELLQGFRGLSDQSAHRGLHIDASIPFDIELKAANRLTLGGERDRADGYVPGPQSLIGEGENGSCPKPRDHQKTRKDS